MERCEADTKRPQVPAQITIPSKTSSHSKKYANNIYLQIHPDKLQGQLQAKPRGLAVSMKAQEISNLIPAKPKKKGKHIHTYIPPQQQQNNSNQWSFISLKKIDLKRYRLTEWNQKQDPSFCCFQETHLIIKYRHYFRVS